MTFRRLLLSALGLAAVGCAALPNGADDILCQKTGDSSCTVIQGDASVDGSIAFETGPGGEAGAVPLARSHLCADGTCSPDDARACIPDGGDASTESCRLVLGAGQQTTASCAKAGAGEDGASCTSGADCAAGFECVGTGTCRHYCCDESSCTTMTANSTNYNTYFCDVASEHAASGAIVPVCQVVVHCSPLKIDQCQTGQACAVVEIDNGKSLVATCDAVGTATLDESCETTHCAAGFACIGTIGQRTCQQLCDSQNPCPSNSQNSNCNMKSQALSQFNVGVCSP